MRDGSRPLERAADMEGVQGQPDMFLHGGKVLQGADHRRFRYLTGSGQGIDQPMVAGVHGHSHARHDLHAVVANRDALLHVSCAIGPLHLDFGYIRHQRLAVRRVFHGPHLIEKRFALDDLLTLIHSVLHQIGNVQRARHKLGLDGTGIIIK